MRFTMLLSACARLRAIPADWTSAFGGLHDYDTSIIAPLIIGDADRGVILLGSTGKQKTRSTSPARKRFRHTLRLLTKQGRAQLSYEHEAGSQIERITRASSTNPEQRPI
jgi:hypothetical protein